jgi:predicted  nucleic acid-binding Zn-ribbon protein
MSTGVERAEAQPQGEGEWQGESWEAEPEMLPYFESVEVEEPQRTALWPRLLAGFLILVALGWIGAVGFVLSQSPPGPELSAWVGWIATASAPLILLGLLWLIFGRTSRRETERFATAVADMRRESQTLENVLAAVASRLEDNRARVTEEAARLMSLGDEASDRLGRVTHYLARETAELERKAQALDSAAESARTDIGVLMGDLPRVEEQARAAAESLRAAGLGAHEQAAALESQFAVLTAKGREADEVVGGAAQRLGAHIARIETGAGAAAERMDQAAAQMNAAVDGALGRAAESVDQARSGLETQGQAMLAMVDQSRAAFESAGAEATRGLAERLEIIGAKIDSLAQNLAAQDAASQALVTGLSSQIAELDEQLAAAGRGGEEQNARLSASLAEVRAATQQLRSEVEAGHAQSGELIGRAQEMGGVLAALGAQLREEIPAALGQVEVQASRTGAVAQAIVPSVEAVQAAAALAAGSMTESEESLNRQQQALGALLSSLHDGVREAEEKLQTLGGAIGETDTAAARLAQQTGPELIEALVRVREAANQAANHAREAISAVIPDSVSALVDASENAVGGAITDAVKDQVAEISTAAQQAVSVARQASERLTRQLLAIGETAATIEARIEEDRAEREQREAENLTRRVALLMEALNSTAIDVNKILSNEVTDTAWAAYLKGDRGVFTRRAVRLLESGEARAIQRHYEEEPDFRDQVNRYVHDFESMLRRVLADRDGTTLGVTLLSSDMGKLYVALAQAIERLRR